MTTDQWSQVRALFDAILDRTTSEQTVLLDASTDDPEVRAKVRELLQLDPVTTDWFGGEVRPEALGAGEGEVQIAELEGRRIGPYRVLEPLGRGGMGSVYLAEREDVQKKVALKLIGVSLSAGESARRFFLIEQRVLARLEHPNIARFLDAGITEEGIPFFAMEYVEGEPITDFCENNALPDSDRLTLFADVCGAVGYAHRGLIVHRDLKPSNIFVTKDGKVKLLDFGIAKLLEEDEGDGLVPDERRRIMTPAYAAPEQLQGEVPTTATDVYQLGIILRELLTGKRSAEKTNDLDAELRFIIAKTTEDTPEGRYASAETLLDDLRRYQTRQPVSAHPDTLPYRARKFVQRNRWGVAAVSVIAVSLIGGFGAALWQARVAGNERDQARLESEKSEEVTRFLVDLFQANDPFETGGDSVTIREVLEEGMKRLKSIEDQPELHASLLNVTADIYNNLGDLERAETLYRRALAIVEERQNHENERANILVGLGNVLVKLGRISEAEPFLRRVVETDTSKNIEDGVRLEALFELYGILHASDRKVAADSIFAEWQRTLGHSSASLDANMAERMVDLSTTLGYRGQIRGELESIEQGKNLLQRALPVLRSVYGPRDPRVAYALTQMAMLLTEETNLRDGGIAPDLLIAADSATRVAVEINRTLYRDPHLDQSLTLLFRASVLRKMRRYNEAESAVREARSIAESVAGRQHPMWAASETELAHIELATRRYDSALTRFNAVRDWWARSYGDDYLKTLHADTYIGMTLMNAGRFEDAETQLLATYARLDKRRGRTDPFTRSALKLLGNLYEAWNKPEEAARYRALLEAAETRDN